MNNETGNSSKVASKTREGIGFRLGIVIAIIISVIVIGLLHRRDKQTTQKIAAQAALQPAETPQFVCQTVDGKTCCSAKMEIKSPSSVDFNFKLPPGAQTVSTKVKPDGIEFCYLPAGVEEETATEEKVNSEEAANEDRYPVLNPVSSIFDRHHFGARNDSGHPHAGVDFECKPYEEVRAGIAGKISFRRVPWNGVPRIGIISSDKTRVKEVAYVNFSKILVADGDEVKADQVIGYTNKRDKKRGLQQVLHVEVTDTTGKKVDPCSVMECQ